MSDSGSGGVFGGGVPGGHRCISGSLIPGSLTNMSGGHLTLDVGELFRVVDDLSLDGDVFVSLDLPLPGDVLH